jgi:hypothetical protein
VPIGEPLRVMIDAADGGILQPAVTRDSVSRLHTARVTGVASTNHLHSGGGMSTRRMTHRDIIVKGRLMVVDSAPAGGGGWFLHTACTALATMDIEKTHAG